MADQELADSHRDDAPRTLREAELRYRTVADFTYDWEYWQAPDGSLRYVSPSCERITGYPAAAFLSNPHLLDEIVLPEDSEAWAEHRRGVTERHGGEVQFRILRRDGEIRWIEHLCQPVTDDHGAFLGYRASNRDATARKQAEEELQRHREHLEELVAERTAELEKANVALKVEVAVRQKAEEAQKEALAEALHATRALQRGEQRYALAQRAAHIGSWDWNILSGGLHWSDQIEPLFGFERGQFGATYEAFLECVHPEDRQRLIDAVDASVEHGADYEIEHRIVWPDGTVRWVLETGDVMRDENGKPVRMVGIVQDVTSRKDAAEALRESEDMFRTVADQSPNMVFVNVKGRVVYANRMCEEITGYTRDEFYAPGFDFLQLIARDDQDLFKSNFAARMTGQDVPSYEYALLTKNGKRIDAIVASKLIRYRGEPAILGTVTDITSRKRVERALRASQRFLQSTVDSLADNIAILDEEGTILAVNDSWRRFGQENGLAWGDGGLGRNYLAVADSSAGKSSGLASEAARGIRAVIGGELDQFSIEYPCHRPGEQRWFVMRVTRFELAGSVRAVILHENITERKLAEETRARLAAIVESSEDAIIGKALDGTILSWNLGAERIYGYSAQEAVGMPISMLLPPDRPDEIAQILDRIKSGGRVAQFHTTRVAKDGRVLHVSLNISPILDEDGQVAGASTIARDITASKRAELALHRATEEARAAREEEEARRLEAERRRSIAESLGDVLKFLNSNRTLKEVLNYIATQAGELLGTRAAGIYALERDTGTWSVQATRGLLVTYVAGARLPVGQSALHRAMTTRQSVAISDLAASQESGEEEPPSADQQIAAASWARIYRALLAVPIVVQDQVYGGMLLYYGEPRSFSQEEIDLAVAFGDQVALAIGNDQLRQQVEEAATSAERDRLARELHDAVTQTLFSASLIAEAMPRVWEQDPEEGRRGLEELRRLTRGAAAEMRTMLVELRPAALTEKPLGELLRHLTEAMAGRTRLPVDLNVDGDSVLQPDIQIALYRITQEALNNVAKHAGASAVTVDLACKPDRTVLRVRDNGAGFEPENVLPDRFGLGIMHERAQGIGAAILIDSEPGKGTRISVTCLN
jgi:PAS domain S-box-containing protein